MQIAQDFELTVGAALHERPGDRLEFAASGGNVVKYRLEDRRFEGCRRHKGRERQIPFTSSMGRKAGGSAFAGIEAVGAGNCDRGPGAAARPARRGDDGGKGECGRRCSDGHLIWRTVLTRLRDRRACGLHGQRNPGRRDTPAARHHRASRLPDANHMAVCQPVMSFGKLASISLMTGRGTPSTN